LRVLACLPEGEHGHQHLRATSQSTVSGAEGESGERAGSAGVGVCGAEVE